jgi:hypothetical protein
MASLYRRPDSPFFWINCKDSSGKWRGRNTRTKNEEEAKIICESLREAEGLAVRGKLYPETVTEILVDTLARTGVKYDPPLPVSTILAEVCLLPVSGFFAYLIKSSDLLKVGSTTRLRSRMGHYRSHNPQYRLLAVRSFENIQQSEAFETDLHKEFSGLWKENEWFKDDKGIRNAFSGRNHGSQLIYLNFLA